MWKLRNFKEKVEHSVLKYSETEIRLREITSDEPWGPTSEELKEVTVMSQRYECYGYMMHALWDRLQNTNSTWRNVYKALIVIDHLIKNGSETISADVRTRSHVLESIRGVRYVDDDGKDQTSSIHNRVKEILSLLSDQERLDEERKKAAAYKRRMEQNMAVGSGNACPPPEDESISHSFRKYLGGIVNKIENSLDVEHRSNRVASLHSDSRSLASVNNALRVESSPTSFNKYADEAKTNRPSSEIRNHDSPPVQESQKALIDFCDFSQPTTQPKNEILSIFDSFESHPTNSTVVSNNMRPVSQAPQIDLFSSNSHNMTNTHQPSHMYSMQSQQHTNINLFEPLSSGSNPTVKIVYPNQQTSNFSSAQQDLFGTFSGNVANQNTKSDINTMMNNNIENLFSQLPPGNYNSQSPYQGSQTGRTKF